MSVQEPFLEWDGVRQAQSSSSPSSGKNAFRAPQDEDETELKTPCCEEDGTMIPGAPTATKAAAGLDASPSFMWSSLGFTCVAFVAGALSWWGPTFLQYSIEFQGMKAELAEVGLLFGIITVVAGILGVALGSAAAQKLKKKHMTADPLVCAFGMIMSMPFLYFGAVVSKHNTSAAYALIFFGEVFLCLNWALVADILLYVVIPTRRSSAEAFQILFSHAFGDAGSPYIIGIVSDAIASRMSSDTTLATKQFVSLEYALFITCFVSVLGGLCFLVCSWYIVGDKKKADEIIKGMQASINSTPSSNSIGLSSITVTISIPVENGLKVDHGPKVANGPKMLNGPNVENGLKVENGPKVENGTKLVNGIPRTSL